MMQQDIHQGKSLYLHSGRTVFPQSKSVNHWELPLLVEKDFYLNGKLE